MLTHVTQPIRTPAVIEIILKAFIMMGKLENGNDFFIEGEVEPTVTEVFKDVFKENHDLPSVD